MCDNNGHGENRIRDELEKQRMRNASGNVTDKRRLVLFLYTLARDSLPVGEIEIALDDVAEDLPEAGGIYTNGWLAEWAADAAERLVKGGGP